MAETIEKKYLGTAGVQQLITNTRTEIAAAEKNAKDYADSLAENYDAAGTATTKVNELANGQVKTNTEHIGTMDDLETTAKADLVTAINEVRNAVSAGGTAAAITMTENTTGLAEGVAKAYVLKQGDNTVGTIDIPKDMVVQSGEVVTNPEGQDAGTYIKLTLANATNDEIFVNVGHLVDVYTGDSATALMGAPAVKVLVDNSSRKIRAEVTIGGIKSQHLDGGAVITTTIADGNVTKAKLSTEVQASLDKADAAAQDATDKAAQALTDAKAHANDLNTAMNTRVEALEAIDHDHSNKTQLDSYDKTQTELLAAAEATAKAYADSKVEGVDLSGIATNAADIDKLEASLAEGGATANAIADAKKAGTDASAHADELNTAMNTRVEALEAIDHDHANKAELDLIASGDKAKWDAAEGNAKTYADGLNTAMNTRVEALEAVTYTEITATEIDNMFKS